jgi:hypothetical protein
VYRLFKKLKNFFVNMISGKPSAKEISKPRSVIKREERMSTVQLPSHLVSLIVGLANDSFNEKDVVVVQINPETGSQSVELNPVLVASLTDSVRDAVKIVAKQRLSDTFERSDASYYNPYLLRSEVYRWGRTTPGFDDMVLEHILCDYQCGVYDPLTKLFWEKAFDVTERLSNLSTKMRRQYLTKVMDTIHIENPELDRAMRNFINGYFYDETLDRLAAQQYQFDPEDEDDLDSIFDGLTYLPAEEPDICIFKWANRSKEGRQRFFQAVSGKLYGNKGANSRARKGHQISKVRDLLATLSEIFPRVQYRQVENIIEQAIISIEEIDVKKYLAV